MAPGLASLPKKCYKTYLGTVTKLKYKFRRNKTQKDDYRHELSMNVCVLLMVVNVALSYRSVQLPAGPGATPRGMTTAIIENDNLKVGNNSCTIDSVSYFNTEDQRQYYKYNSMSAVYFHYTVSIDKELLLNFVSNPLTDDIYVHTYFNQVYKGYPSLLVRAVTLAILFMLLLLCLHIKQTFKEQICLASPQPVTWQLLLFRHLPLRSFSRLMGCLTAIQWPVFPRYMILAVFVWFFHIKLNEAVRQSLREYTSIRDIFRRRLRSEIRPIDRTHDLVCPVDGTVMHVGVVTGNYIIEQVKGVQYSLKTFLGRGVLPEYGHSSDGLILHTVVLYLSPGDYHHFHSPANWNVHLYRHFPGELVTVSPWAVKSMPGLFALNERVLMSGQWVYGYFSMTAVGALNVGSIYLDNYQELETNLKGHYKFNTYTDKHVGRKVWKGDHMGGFNFGSTIVLLFEAPPDFKLKVAVGDRIKYGEQLGTL